MLNVEMELRQCLKCNNKFKVMTSSKQSHCSEMCRGDSHWSKFKPNKIAPIKIDRSGKIVDEQEDTYEVVVTKKENKSNMDLWQSYVDRARKIVRSMAKDRMELAQIAISACDIKWGGGDHWNNHDDVSTLKKFAEEAGISYKTISSYVRAYRNVVEKLPEGVYDESDYAALTRTSNSVNSKTPKGTVVNIYKKEISRKVDRSIALATMIKRLRNVCYWFTNTDINKFHKEDIVKLNAICEEILRHTESRK